MTSTPKHYGRCGIHMFVDRDRARLPCTVCAENYAISISEPAKPRYMTSTVGTANSDKRCHNGGGSAAAAKVMQGMYRLHSSAKKARALEKAAAARELNGQFRKAEAETTEP